MRLNRLRDDLYGALEMVSVSLIWWDEILFANQRKEVALVFVICLSKIMLFV